MIDGIRHFVYTKHNGDNAKLKIFFIIPQRQRIQPNFKNDNIRTFPSYIPNNLTYKYNLNNKNNDINVGFTSNKQNLCSYNWDNANSRVFTFRLHNKFVQSYRFPLSTILQSSSIVKNLYLACRAISYITFIPWSGFLPCQIPKLEWSAFKLSKLLNFNFFAQLFILDVW